MNINRKNKRQIIFDKPKEQNSFYKQNPQYFNELVKLINDNPIVYSIRLNAKGRKRDVGIIPPYKHLLDWINTVTAFKLLDPFYKTPTKCYWILHDLHDFPKCVVCGSQEHYKKVNVHLWSGYHRTCSLKCKQLDELTIKRRIETCNKKYGVDNPFQSLEIIAKCDNTRFIRYGDKKFTNRQKFKETKKRHAQEDPLYQQKINEKVRLCCQSRFGYDNSAQCPEIIAKSKKKYKFNGIMFDSSIEIAYYIFMKDHNEEIQRSNITFKFTFNGKICYYIPDFYLPKYNQYIEIKGDHFFKEDGTLYIPWKGNMSDERYNYLCEKAKAKQQCMIQNNIKIILESSDEIKNIKQYIKNKYGKNYLRQFKYEKL